MIINGNAYSNSDLGVFFDGVPVLGVSQISFGSSRNYEMNFGVSPHPYNRGAGKINHEASITLYNSELEALRVASPTGFLFDIPPFNITIEMSPIGKTPVVYTLFNVKLTNDGISTGVDDTKVETEITLSVGNIAYTQ